MNLLICDWPWEMMSPWENICIHLQSVSVSVILVHSWLTIAYLNLLIVLEEKGSVKKSEWPEPRSAAINNFCDELRLTVCNYNVVRQLRVSASNDFLGEIITNLRLSHSALHALIWLTLKVNVLGISLCSLFSRRISIVYWTFSSSHIRFESKGIKRSQTTMFNDAVNNVLNYAH